jgi:hypothetical protein
MLFVSASVPVAEPDGASMPRNVPLISDAVNEVMITIPLPPCCDAASTAVLHSQPTSFGRSATRSSQPYVVTWVQRTDA